MTVEENIQAAQAIEFRLAALELDAGLYEGTPALAAWLTEGDAPYNDYQIKKTCYQLAFSAVTETRLDNAKKMYDWVTTGEES
jgi:hypothetical protein